MNDELKTKEYLKEIESLTLADSSRVRMREDLLAHVRFHAVSEVTAPKSVPSPFLSFFMRPAPVAFVMVLLVGTTAFYLNKEKTAELALVDDTSQPAKDSSTSVDQTDVAPAGVEEQGEILVPTLATNQPTPDTQPDSIVAMNTRAKSAPTPEAASTDMASDEMFMTSELSAGTWSIADQQADIEKRLDGLRALIKKYDVEIEADLKIEFTTKLDTAATLKSESEGKSELDARANLDKASVLIGEVESTLSLLGEVVVEDGYIVDVKLR
jgi:hypothetical protein